MVVELVKSDGLNTKQILLFKTRLHASLFPFMTYLPTLGITSCFGM